MTEDADEIMIAKELYDLSNDIYKTFIKADKIHDFIKKNHLVKDSNFYSEVCRPLKNSLRETSSLYFELKDKE